jgi:hypothetical protein
VERALPDSPLASLDGAGLFVHDGPVVDVATGRGTLLERLQAATLLHRRRGATSSPANPAARGSL